MDSRMQNHGSIGREVEMIAFFISRACAYAIIMEVIILVVTEYARHASVVAVMS